MIYLYKAMDSKGKVVSGEYNASGTDQVSIYLQGQNLIPINISEKKTNAESHAMEIKPNAKDLGIFCEQFCALLRSGVSIIDTLKLLAGQTKNKRLTHAIEDAIQGLNEGDPLATAMERSHTFDKTFISLVRAGEESGSLDASLERMAVQYKKDAEVKSAVKQALVYPIIVMVVAIAVVVFMLLYIVPAFMDMFNDIGIDMPKITLMVVAASKWLQENWMTALLIVGGTIFGLIVFAKSESGKRINSRISLLLPGVNSFVIKTHSSKIARTLSTLLTAGMGIPEALGILEETLPNYYYREAIREIRTEVLNGKPMSEKFLENQKMFPPMLSHMISVGEETGDMPTMLTKTAEYYDLEVETATKSMMTMIQPMIILLLSAIVGVVLAAVLSPMVSLYSQLGDKL